MTLNAIVAVCADVIFQNQCRASAVAYARTVLNEVASAHTALQNGRWALAQAVIVDGGVSTLTRVVWTIANSGAGTFALNDTTDANDSLINSAMITEWNTIAGLTSSQQVN